MHRTLLTGVVTAALLTPLPLAAAASADPTAPAERAGAQDYYADADGLTGDALRDALHAIISTGTTTLSYDEVWDALKDTDQNPADAGSVLLFYTGESRDADLNGGNVGDWNREHVWAQSHGDFGTSPGPGTDVHHLRPTDVQVNSYRGNLDFDNGGSPVPDAPGNAADGDSFEPRDEDKGDVARMIFYMALRYEGDDGFADLEVNDAVDNGGSPYMGRVSTLLAWHEQDPPDAFEERRNEVIYTDYQHNRNPFIDHPEWGAELFG